MNVVATSPGIVIEGLVGIVVRGGGVEGVVVGGVCTVGSTVGEVLPSVGCIEVVEIVAVEPKF